MPLLYNFGPSAWNLYSNSSTGSSIPTGTNIAILGGVAIPPYINSTSQSPTNSITWQMFYANQNVSFTQIQQYTYISGSNSWTYYICKATSPNTQSFSQSNIASIGNASVSYTSGGLTTTNLTSTQSVLAGYYFLIGCVNGPYYKTFNSTTQNYVFTSSGNSKLTMINKTYWRTHYVATVDIPTSIGGTGTGFNIPTNTIWCIGLGGVS
jgi:hypothetical protein